MGADLPARQQDNIPVTADARFTRVIAPVWVVLVVGVIEAIRLTGGTPPVPFLLLFGSVVYSAAVGGVRAGLLGAAVTAVYIVYAGTVGFGPVHLVGHPLREAAGIAIILFIALVLGRLQDQTRLYRTRMEEYLQARYRALVRNAPEGILVADAEDGRIIDGNPRAMDMFGLSDIVEPLPTVADLSPPTQPDGRPSAAAASEYMNKALTDGPITFEWMHKRLSGELVPCEVSLSHLPDHRGRLVHGMVRDISQRKKTEVLREGEHEVLRSIASARPLTESLNCLASVVEKVVPQAICSILRLDDDGKHIRHLAAPSLSDAFSHGIDGLTIGPDVGSCGTAMFYDRQVIVEDIATDPRWEKYCDAAAQEGLRACWSMPIHDSTQKVIGSFALYYRTPRRPTDEELTTIARLKNLAGIAIEVSKNSEALRHREALYRVTFEHAAAGMAHVSPSGHYMRANAKFCEMIGYNEDELTKLDFQTVTHPDDINDNLRWYRQMLAGEADNYHVKKRWIRKDGSIVWVNMSVGTVRTDNGDVERFVVVAEDVSEAHQLSQELTYQARHDGLTGLINRRELESQLEQFMGQVLAGQQTGAFCYLDLDQFKLVNDTAGHVAGDEMLRQLAPRLRETIRTADTLARLGGDEFGVLLRGCTTEDAVEVADKMRNIVEEFAFVWGEHTFKPGVSIGVVPLNGDALTTVTDVLQTADTVCYAAKDEGRNRFKVWREDDASLYRRQGEMQWVPRLTRALDEDLFVFEAQPIIGIDDQDKPPHWFELLVRLQENGEIVPPGAFLPAAERYGLSPRLDRLVVRKALEWLRHQRAQRRRALLSVNLSGLSLSDPIFCDYLAQTLSDAGDLARDLCFEITETAAIGNLMQAVDLMQNVRSFGSTIALDDFGSGLSSFAYLKNLPADFLKIDGTFVRDIAHDPMDLIIVQSIHDLAKVMDKYTIAEFVEDEAIMDILKEIGVDYAQGFWLGRPQRIETIESETLPVT